MSAQWEGTSSTRLVGSSPQQKKVKFLCCAVLGMGFPLSATATLGADLAARGE
jgi:hypothetical protein